MNSVMKNTLVKYIISGCTAALVNLTTLHFLDVYSGFHYLLSVNIAFITAFFISFFMQKYWTFSDNRKDKTGLQLIKYFSISVINVFLNSFLIYLLVSKIEIPGILFLRQVVLAQILSAIIVAIESYFVYKILIFDKKPITNDQNKPKRILIITQKIDKDDSYFGFFHDWVKLFAETCEKVTVVSLETYSYDLPSNVEVLSLGKENLKSRFNYLKLFYKYIIGNRDKYDSVFCHMSPLYVIFGYPVWSILNKKIVLWYVHRSVDFKLHLSHILVDEVLTSTRESFGIKSNKVKYLGQAVSVDHFSNKLGERKPDGSFNIITVGRITPIKRIDIAIESLALLIENKVPAKLYIAGAPTMEGDFEYESMLQRKIKDLGLDDSVVFLGPIPYKNIPKYYWDSDVCINLAPTGGLDKTVLEAMMAGLPVITSNKAFTEHLNGYVKDLLCNDSDPKDTALKLYNLYNSKNYSFVGFSLRKEVLKRSTLDVLISNITKEL